MQEHTKCADSHTTGYAFVAWPVNVTWPDDDVWYPKPGAKFKDDFVLLDFRETVRVSPFRGTCFHWAGLIQHTAGLLPVSVNSEGTDVYKPFEALMPKRGFQKIPCRDHRIQKSIREELLAAPCGKVKDH